MQCTHGKHVLVAAVATATFAAQSASAQPVHNNLGSKGQFVIGAERLTGVSFNKIQGDGATVSVTDITLLSNQSVAPSNKPRIGFDYLVTDRVSLGLSGYYMHTSVGVDVDGGTSQDVMSGSVVFLNPRMGYAYAVNDTFALWPRLGFAWAHASNSAEGDAPELAGTDSDSSSNSTQLTLEGNLVLSPVQHFAIVGGPFLDLGLGGNVEIAGGEADIKYTSYGLTAGIAGYF